MEKKTVQTFDLNLIRNFPLNSMDEVDKVEQSLSEGPNSAMWQALVRKMT